MRKYIKIYLISAAALNFALLPLEAALAQSFDSESDKPPMSSGFHDGNSWRPFIPQPFKGCDLVINHNPQPDRLTIDVKLKNLGYTSEVRVTDSVVFVEVTCVAEGIPANSNVPVLLPNRFELFVLIDEGDTAHYLIDYRDGLLNTEKIVEIKGIHVESANSVASTLHWIQFKSSKISLLLRVNNDFEKVADIEILDEGYYLGFPLRILEGKTRNFRFNKTRIGAIVFVKTLNDSTLLYMNQLVNDYMMKGLVVAQGVLLPPGINRDGE